MLTTGILNPHVLSLMARVRHTNTLVIADRGFPFWPQIETIDLSLVDDIPTVLDVLRAVQANFAIGHVWMAQEFLGAKQRRHARQVCPGPAVDVRAERRFQAPRAAGHWSDPHGRHRAVCEPDFAIRVKTSHEHRTQAYFSHIAVGGSARHTATASRRSGCGGTRGRPPRGFGHLSAPGDVQSRERMRHRRGRAVGWAIVGHHLRAALAERLVRQALRDHAALTQTIRPESVGGTPANRMIHRESQQLFIGPYAIDEERNVRVIPPSVMSGRLTGKARHLTDPAGKIYYATMEEGFYEVDVRTLTVKELWPDANRLKDHAGDAAAGLSRQGALFGPGAARVCEQRRAFARGPAAARYRVRRAGRVGGPRLDGRPPQPVHRSDRPRRHRGQCEARATRSGASAGTIAR